MLALTLVLVAAPPSPVTALAFSPDGGVLAVGRYGRAECLDAAGGRVAEFAGLARQVTAAAYSRDGKALALAAGEPGRAGSLRVVGVPGGKVLWENAAAHKDRVAAVAFAPNGSLLASVSYDRAVKLWDARDGKLLRTLADHSDSVYGVAFHPSGMLLATVSADRAVKVWDVGTGKRNYTLSEATDWLYAVAWSPDGKRLAAGGVDRSLRVWEADAAGGRLVGSAFAHEAAVLALAYSADGTALVSLGEDRVVKRWDAAKLVETSVLPARPDAVQSLALSFDGVTAALGRFDGVVERINLLTGKPATPPAPKPVSALDNVPDRFAPVAEATASAGVTLPASVAGKLERAGEADRFPVALAAGQELGVQIAVAEGPPLDAVLEVRDAAAEVLARSDRGFLGFRAAKAGTVAVSVHDRESRGGAMYKLHLGPIPVVTGAFPLGGRRGDTIDVTLEGVFLSSRVAKVTIPATAGVGTRVPVPGDAVGRPELVVGEFPEAVAPGRIAVPGVGNGVLATGDATQEWAFEAKKGQRLIVETHARRLGSPLDTSVEIADASGRVLERATLRCQAKTTVHLRDHDANKAGVRMETWGEFAMGDHVYADGELMRLDELPKNPDDDAQYAAVAGKRVGFLGTTPTYHAYGAALYKVEVHPPGATFPPNGMPVFRVPYRNDDGGPGYDKDSALDFTAPVDGVYTARVKSADAAGGPGHAYRLTVRPPKPDFAVSYTPRSPAVWRGNGVPLTAVATRSDGFAGPIRLSWKNVPAGFRVPDAVIEAGRTETVVTLSVDATAAAPKGDSPKMELVATAMIDGTDVTRTTPGGLPTIDDGGDLRTAVREAEVRLAPGRETKFTVTIERRNGFKGRVPLEVKGLPYGVRVLNIGLNGILVLPSQTSREVTLYAEPWVKPMAMPMTVLSQREGTAAQHAAPATRLVIGP